MATIRTFDEMVLNCWTDLLTGTQLDRHFKDLIAFCPSVGIDQRERFALATFNDLKTFATNAWHENNGEEFILARSTAVEKFGEDPFKRAA